MMTNKKHINAVVIGSGAGGGVVTKELASKGYSVIVLERGNWIGYGKHANDELWDQRTQVLGATFGPDFKKNPRTKVDTKGKETLLDSGRGYGNVAACVGSGTVSYGAMGWRFMEEDFKMKSTYGSVEGSTLDDWPISYHDLEPYYEKAEWEIGVSGDDSKNPFAPPRKKPQPMPAFENNKEGKVLSAAAEKMGWHPFSIPMLRNSIPFNGISACMRNSICVGNACPISAKNGTHNTVIPKAIETGNCEVKTGCFVSEVVIDEQGKAKAVKYFDRYGRENIQTADIVVVSASATETARLLLNSKSRLFPNGAGNNNDWVGRNLQGHAYTGAFGLFDYDILDHKGNGATMAICDFNHHNDGIIGGGLLANEFNRLPYQFTHIRPPGASKWGKEHKEFQRVNFKRISQFVGPIQEMPNFESRVTVSPNVKDHWGIPVVQFSGGRHPLDREHCKFLSEKAEMLLKEAGAIKTWQHLGGKGQGGGHHQAGTARMGNDKKTSVTNKYGQVHDIDNLFIADGSLIPNNGGFNPSLTIMALGYWVGEHISENFKHVIKS
tara:strand:- start:4898 stop:6553 length:1656 start_codon:yes stop_codon:yes gene_type:complete